MRRTVVVTGGGTGIGRAVAEAFVAGGDAVVITGRRQRTLDATAAELGPNVRAVVCDATDPAQVAALRAELPGTVDVLVNMAGGNVDFAAPPGDDPSLEDVAAAWRANLDANLLSAVLTTAGLLPAIPAGGAVVNVGSIGAEYAASSYGAAKAAVAAWTAGLSAQVGPRGITANTIAPGYVAETDFFRDQLADDRRAQLVAATHDQRAGRPGDIAATARFLASPGARHITGQTLHVNGGAHTTR